MWLCVLDNLTYFIVVILNVDGSVYVVSLISTEAFLSFHAQLTGSDILAQHTDTYQWN